jgi:hypothetical protein
MCNVERSAGELKIVACLRGPSIKVLDRDIRAFIRAGTLPAEKSDDPKAIAHTVHKVPRLYGRAAAF